MGVVSILTTPYPIYVHGMNDIQLLADYPWCCRCTDLNVALTFCVVEADAVD